MRPRWIEGAAVALLISVHGGLALRASWNASATVDEYAHLPAGCAALRHGAFDLYGKTPPLGRVPLALPALALGARVPPPALPTGGGGWDPWRYGDAFLAANAGSEGLGRYPALLRAARLGSAAVAVGALLILYAWARAAHGPAGALVALLLLALSPTFLAHAGLATTDVPATAATLLATWLCWRALLRGGGGRWAVAGAALGGAVAVKFTALVLLPLLPLWAWVARRCGVPAPPPRRSAAAAALLLLAALLTLHAAYRFPTPVSRLDSFQFFSAAGAGAARRLPGWLPVPLPAALVRGLDAQSLDLEQAEMPNYLNGRWSRQGWWYYYPEALLLKTPLALLPILLIAVVLGLRRSVPPPPAAAPARRLALAMAATVAGALLLASLLARLDIGVRYLLPAFPFLHLLAGGLGARVPQGSRRLRAAVGLLCAAYVVEALAGSPRPLVFFNRLAGGPAGGWRYLANSNNDWGQDLGRLAAWLREHRAADEPLHLAYFGHVDPARYGLRYRLPPEQPQPGLHAVSLNLLLGMPYVVWEDRRWVLVGEDLSRPQQRFAWLRQRRPVARIGETIWVYRVPEDSAAVGRSTGTTRASNRSG